MVKIFKLYICDELKIGIKKELSSTELEKLKTLPFFHHSPENDSYYIPYTKKAVAQLRLLKVTIQNLETGTANENEPKSENTGKSEIPINAVMSGVPKNVATDIPQNNEGKFNIRWNGKYFILKLAYNENHVAFIKTLESSFWHDQFQNWIAKSSLKNLKDINEYFNCWNEKKYNQIRELIKKQASPMMLEVFTSPEFHDQYILRLRGYGIDISYIKKFKNRTYDKEYKRWLIPKSKEVIDNIISHYASKGVKIVNRLPEHNDEPTSTVNPDLQRKIRSYLQSMPIHLRPNIKGYSDMMVRQKYGWRTIINYTKKMINFSLHYPECDLAELTAGDVNNFMSNLANKGISHSLQNTYLSAIKLFYEKVKYRSEFEIEKLERPRKSRYLPTILSEGEVDKIFRTLTNLKHITMLYTIYGGGLRLSEILELRVKDIYWDRNQIFIRRGKGQKDRVSIMSQTLKEVLRSYFDVYMPVHYLFEGQDKKSPYSSSSVQSIVRRAAKAAGIQRRVTPHTLRHCFATHLLDRGTDVRYIQELLGHKDIKTTLIYTHVTTRSMENIISPLDRISNVGINYKNAHK